MRTGHMKGGRRTPNIQPLPLPPPGHMEPSKCCWLTLVCPVTSGHSCSFWRTSSQVGSLELWSNHCLNFYHINLLIYCWGGRHVLQFMCGGQKTTCRDQFSPSPVWTPGIRPESLVAGTFPNKSSLSLPLIKQLKGGYTVPFCWP